MVRERWIHAYLLRDKERSRRREPDGTARSKEKRKLSRSLFLCFSLRHPLSSSTSFFISQEICGEREVDSCVSLGEIKKEVEEEREDDIERNRERESERVYSSL